MSAIKQTTINRVVVAGEKDKADDAVAVLCDEVGFFAGLTAPGACTR